jgi:hypothetical protein
MALEANASAVVIASKRHHFIIGLRYALISIIFGSHLIKV